MLTKKDRRYARKRKRLWDIMGWTYSGTQFLSKNHSLNCGCVVCQMKTYERRLNNKRERLKNKRDLRKIDFVE